MRLGGIVAAACCVAVMGPEAVAAQMTADPATQENGLGEIVVTARKRQESVLRVPVVTTVLPAAQLERRQVTDLYSIGTLTPGLVLGRGSLETGTQISIRGVGTSSLDPGIDQSVSLNVDGFLFSQGTAYSIGVFDMARVEVLKGPQALFYGKTSTAGVISITTADPGSKLEVIGRLSHEFEADEWRGEAILSGPLTDTLGLRVAARFADYDGFFRNNADPVAATGATPPDKHIAGTKSLYLRGTALFKPSNAFTARLKLNYARDRVTGGVAQQLTSCPDGKTNFLSPPFPSFYATNEDCRQDRTLAITYVSPTAFPYAPNGGNLYLNTYLKFGSLDMNYNLSPQLTLSSVTGYYTLHVTALTNAGNAGHAAPGLLADKDFHRRQFTQELRLTSDFSSPLNFTAGAFYEKGKINSLPILWGNTLPPYGYPTVTVGRAPVLSAGHHRIPIETISGFGQLRVRPVSTVEIAGGVRYADEKRHDDADFRTGGAVGVRSVIDTGSTYVAVVEPRLHSKTWSPEATITWTPTADLTLFGSVKQGYKSGSYTITTGTAPGSNNSFGDERVRGGEVGVKSRLLDRQVFTNVAFYYYKYRGLQVGANETAQNLIPVIRTVNAGALRVYGIDFDIDYRPQALPGLDVRGAVNWNRAKFTDFTGAPCWGGQTIAEGCNQNFNPATGRYQGQDLTGTAPTRAPEWQVNGGATYELAFADGMHATFGGDAQYSSRYLATLGRRADFFQKGYVKLNANFAVRGRNDGWEVALIGNNLNNKLRAGTCANLNYGGNNIAGIVTGAATKGPGGSDEVVCTVDRGRELWVRLTLRPADLLR